MQLQFESCLYDCHLKKKRMYCRKHIPKCAIILGEVIQENQENGTSFKLVWDLAKRHYIIYVDNQKHNDYRFVDQALQTYWTLVEGKRKKNLGADIYEAPAFKYSTPTSTQTITTDDSQFTCYGKQGYRGYRVYCRRDKKK